MYNRRISTAFIYDPENQLLIFLAFHDINTSFMKMFSETYCRIHRSESNILTSCTIFNQIQIKEEDDDKELENIIKNSMEFIQNQMENISNPPIAKFVHWGDINLGKFQKNYPNFIKNDEIYVNFLKTHCPSCDNADKKFILTSSDNHSDYKNNFISYDKYINSEFWPKKEDIKRIEFLSSENWNIPDANNHISNEQNLPEPIQNFIPKPINNKWKNDANPEKYTHPKPQKSSLHNLNSFFNHSIIVASSLANYFVCRKTPIHPVDLPNKIMKARPTNPITDTGTLHPSI